MSIGHDTAARSKSATTALTTTTTRSSGADADWTHTVPLIVKSRHLSFSERTASSAARIRSSLGAFCDGTALSLEIEDALFEAFLEDDYDGRLHLTTLDDGDDGDGGGAVVGIVFWREVPEDEMRKWIDLDALSCMCRLSSSKALLEPCEEGADGSEGGGLSGERRHASLGSSLANVRQESLRWLTEASSSMSRDIDLPSSSEALTTKTAAAAAPKTTTGPLTLPFNGALFHAWVKIELLAVRREYWGQGNGTLLLACALLQAYLLNNARAVLHVAGGTSNVPAVRLYEKFGFVPVERGTVFRKPDRDLYVLGNIGRSLGALAWSETLGRGGERLSPS